MTTADAVAALQSGNEDIVVARVSGSVKLAYLPDEIQGKLTGNDRDELLAAFVLEATEKAQGA